jgi:ATP-dependent DNA helicase Rep
MYGLNPAQLAAVENTHAPMLVLAGAGSGKTRVITQKIAHMIGVNGWSARSIIAVTFTNKAAREMRERVDSVLAERGLNSRGLIVSTFHSLGLRFVRQELAALGLRKGFSIFDQADAEGVIAEIMGPKAREKDNPINAQMVQGQISNLKNRLISPEQAENLADTELEAIVATIYLRYERLLRAYNAVDFDDLLILPVRLLQQNRELRERWQHRLRHVLVDEYQDTNTTQYELVKLLVGPVGAFTVVGDDDQSIYAWRGAEPENLLNLKTDYPRLEVVKLEQNYRSTSTILDAANKVISNNPHLFEKKLWSGLGQGDQIEVAKTRSADDEAMRVASELVLRRARSDAQWRDFALLYRGNFQARGFERALRERNIPYRINGGRSFFDNAEIKDLLAYLRIIVNPADDSAFLRIVNVPSREIGAVSLEKLGAVAKRHDCSLFQACDKVDLETTVGKRAGSRLVQFHQWILKLQTRAESDEPSQIAWQLLEDIDYHGWLVGRSASDAQAQKRYENLGSLIDWLKRLANPEETPEVDELEGSEEMQGNHRLLEEVVRKIGLIDIMDRQNNEDEENQVQLMTLHASKGLEFPHVIMVGLEEELLPHRNSIESEAGIQEERRLMYVGITRAKKTLLMTYTAKRKRYGEEFRPEPSRFLDELPDDCVTWIGRADKKNEDAHAVGTTHLSALSSLLKKSSSQG